MTSPSPVGGATFASCPKPAVARIAAPAKSNTAEEAPHGNEQGSRGPQDERPTAFADTVGTDVPSEADSASDDLTAEELESLLNSAWSLTISYRSELGLRCNQSVDEATCPDGMQAAQFAAIVAKLRSANFAYVQGLAFQAGYWLEPMDEESVDPVTPDGVSNDLD